MKVESAHNDSFKNENEELSNDEVEKEEEEDDESDAGGWISGTLPPNVSVPEVLILIL